MPPAYQTRRHFLATGAAAIGTVAATGTFGLLVPARAQGLAPTETMRGGANNYRPGAPIVERIGNGGFWMSGTVRRAGDGARSRAPGSRSGPTRPRDTSVTPGATAPR